MPLHCANESVVVEAVGFLSGPYRLEGELAYSETSASLAAAVLAGPHPLLGGNMHNNVVRGLGDGLAEGHLATLRFNYRGVGRSQGPEVDVAEHLARFWTTSHVPDEMDLCQDVQGAVDFVQQVVDPDLPLALVGYSFGCALLPHVRVEKNPAALVLIAPTVAKHNYDSFMEVRRPTLVIASEDDFAIDTRELQRWFARLPMPKALIQERFDNHFFRGYERWLAKTIFDFI